MSAKKTHKSGIILGIDPGTTIMGYGLLKVVGTKPQVMTMGVIDLRKYGDHYLKLRSSAALPGNRRKLQPSG